MDGLEFSVELTKGLAWPITTMVLAFTFRSEVRRLLNRIKSMKGPAGTEAEFADEVREIQERADRKLGTEHPDGQLNLELLQSAAKGHGLELNLGHTMDLKSPPGIVVLRAYSAIEEAMKTLIDDLNLKPASAPAGVPGFYAYTLMEAGVIDQETMEMIHSLRRLRDNIWQIEPDRKTAADYYFATRRVLGLLGRELHRVRSQSAMQVG